MNDQAIHTQRWSRRWLAASFVHPLFDFALIGGGLSLAVALIIFLKRGTAGFELVAASLLPVFVLFCNSAHFAASTVRLYTRPRSFETWPILTMLFPLITLLMLLGCLMAPGTLGDPLRMIYLTWSPFHYAAQAYGLAVMYSFRSGRSLEARDRHLLWLVCLVPFLFNLAYGRSAAFHWLGRAVGRSDASVFLLLDRIQYGIVLLAWAIPLLYFAGTSLSRRGALPLISMVIVLTNTVWWLTLQQLDAFVWATIFHGVQYLAIVVIFHVKDQAAESGVNPSGRQILVSVVQFYALCLGLGYALFQCLPLAFRLSGFGLVESYLLVTATINIHHFIVDAFIWKLRSDRENRRIVEAGAVAV